MSKKAHIFDPELLEILVTLAERRSFTETARTLKLSQSKVSSSIGRLEEAVGCRLVNRTTHSVLLTNDGEEMVRYARMVKDLSEQAERRFSQPNCADIVRLGLFTDFDSVVLSDVLREFHDRHPAIQLVVETGRSDILLSRIRDGGLDLALVTRMPGHGFGPPLWEDEFVWVGHGKVPKNLREPIPLAVAVRPSMLRRVGVEALNVARRPHYISFESNAYTNVATAVGAGLGFSVFTRLIRPLDVPVVAPDLLPPLGRMEIVLLKSEKEAQDGITTLYDILRGLSPRLFETAAESMFRSTSRLVAASGPSR